MNPSHEHSPTSPTSAHASHDADAAHHDMHLKLYFGIGGLLFLFTAITVWLSYVDFDKWLGGHGWNIIVAMIVATFKVSLVAAIFMHLRSERWTIYRVMILTMIFVTGLFFLTLLAYLDPIRSHHP